MAGRANPTGAVAFNGSTPHVVHQWLAAFYVFTLPLQTAPKEIAFALLVLWSLIRIRSIWRTCVDLSRDRPGWLLVIWASWTALSLAWSQDPAHGVEELAAFRFLLTGFVLAPVLDRAAWLIVAFLLGVFVQNGVQLGQGLQLFGLEPGAQNRLGGLTSPITAGLICGMAMCWHLAAVLASRSAWRWIGVVGFFAAAGGMVFSGSRGPWIAAALVLPLEVIVIAVRRPPTRRVALIVTTLVVIAAAASWPIARPMVENRVERALEDLRVAQDDAYGTDVGFRLLCWRTSWRMFRDRPLHGSGVGAFYVETELVRNTRTNISAGHAHSIFFHALGCTGLVGLGLMLATLAAYGARAWGVVRPPPWADGTFYALLLWTVAGAFDTFHVSGQTFGILMVVFALAAPPLTNRADALR
ncbi:MAG: O-antigen ligase family protein [Phycisphaerales bacterium]|nr:O-antigen ligase family protein [Phycisphaerales bacterium]NNM25871.1 O-antigen ligase family protein [Phycisphaerales bacterium]